MIAALYFGSETRTFKSKEEAQKHIERDAADIAAERGGEVVDYGNGDDIEEVVNRLAAIGYALEDALAKALLKRRVAMPAQPHRSLRRAIDRLGSRLFAGGNKSS